MRERHWKNRIKYNERNVMGDIKHPLHFIILNPGGINK